MPRPEKVAAVSEIKDRLAGAQAVFLAEYAGLSVKAQQALRRSLKAQGAEFQVVKMTLARRAADELDLDELDAMLVGPTGLTFADGDAVAAAKVLKDFAAANDVFTVKGGLLGTTVLTPERIRQLADIEPREVLLAKLAGLFKAPTAAMAGLLAALPRGAATVLNALLDKKTADEPAPEAESAPELPTEEPDGVPAEAEPSAEEAPAEPAAEVESPETEDAVADEITETAEATEVEPEDGEAAGSDAEEPPAEPAAEVESPETEDAVADEITETAEAVEAEAAEEPDNEEVETEDDKAAEAEEEN